MDKKFSTKHFTEILKKQEIQDYSYAILFFLVSSFFAFAVIRPVLGIAIALQREGEDLKRINETYEGNIAHVLETQALLEEIRPQLYLLDQALPEEPDLKTLVEDFRKIGREENVRIENVSIESISLKDAENAQSDSDDDTGEVKGIRIGVNISGDYTDVQRFIRALVDQRRLKTVHSISLSREGVPDEDGAVISVLRLRMDVQAYHL